MPQDTHFDAVVVGTGLGVGLPAGAVAAFADSETAAPAVVAAIEAGDTILVKGSRGIRTDVVADRIAAEWA